MAIYSIVNTLPEHITVIANYLQPKTIKEMAKLGFTPEAGLTDSVNGSYEAYTFLVNGNPCSLFGLCAFDAVSSKPCTWTSSSSLIEHHMKTYIKGIRYITDNWLDKYERLYGLIDNDYPEALRIFYLAGFVDDELRYYNGFPFMRVVKDTKYGRC